MNIELFLGRFHPLVVHLPIGFLIIAAVMEGLSRLLKSRFIGLDSAISIALFSSGVGAVGAAIMGYMLASGGGYDDQTLFWHQWLGILLAAISFIGWAVKSQVVKSPKSLASAVIVLLVILVSITGHLGGNLTHGSDYLLAYAPPAIQKAFGQEVEHGTDQLPSQIDSILVFDHLIKPALKAKCYQCHNETKNNGGLLLTTEEGIVEGGDTGENLIKGKAAESQLFQRVTLPQSNKKFMPPKGDPLTYSELKLIEWWINAGASFESKLSETEVPAEINTLLLRDYDLDTSPKALHDLLTAPVLSDELLQEVRASGYSISTLSMGHALYQAKFDKKQMSSEAFEVLGKASEQITWLNLVNKGVTDEFLTQIPKFKNLTVLKLSGNPVTDEGVKHLKSLQYLQSLNLYGTMVTDKSLSILKELPSLKKVFLWQTKVSQEAVETLREERPELIIEMGFSS